MLDKVPPTFFKNDVLPLVDGLATEHIQRLCFSDKLAPLKMVRRLGCFPLSMTVHTTDKAVLARDYATRINALGGVDGRLEWSSQYSIEWPTCGHFVLLPPIPDKCDPKDHQYEHITFMGRYGDLGLSDTRIRGTYIVDSNWAFETACVFYPLKPWSKIPCGIFFAKECIKSLVPPIAFSPVSPQPAIADIPRQAALTDATNEHLAIENVVAASVSSGLSVCDGIVFDSEGTEVCAPSTPTFTSPCKSIGGSGSCEPPTPCAKLADVLVPPTPSAQMMAPVVCAPGRKRLAPPSAPSAKKSNALDALKKKLRINKKQ